MTIKRNRFGAGDEENLRLIVKGLEERINQIDPEAIKDALINSANIDSIVNVDVDENSSEALKEAEYLAKLYIAVRNVEKLKLTYAGNILQGALKKLKVDQSIINAINDKIAKVLPEELFIRYEDDLNNVPIFELEEAGKEQINDSNVFYETNIKPGVGIFIDDVLSGSGAFGRTKRRRKTSKRKTSSRKTLKKRKKVKRRSS